MAIPRSALHQTHHRQIDAVLKDLKICSRRLKTALDSVTDELRTLERLYYKCKNQHRMALFFKRVSEIRRYGHRLYELDFTERVDLLRASFVGLAHTDDAKALRGPWSYVPEKSCVSSLTDKLAASSALVCKMRERLQNAYSHFMLAMQTGAFVQFMVLFLAISSRMSALSSELVEALDLGMSTCNRLLCIIDQPASSSPSGVVDDVPPEDTGQTIPCDVASPPNRPADSRDESSAKAAPSKKAVVKVKKKKKKFDEIDEIFGF